MESSYCSFKAFLCQKIHAVFLEVDSVMESPKTTEMKGVNCPDDFNISTNPWNPGMTTNSPKHSCFGLVGVFHKHDGKNESTDYACIALTEIDTHDTAMLVKTCKT
jgi:hypothetical protein